MSDEGEKTAGKRRRRKIDEPRSTYTVRLPTVMRGHLEAAAEGNGRSLAEEIERRLAQSIEVDDVFGGVPTAQIGRLVAVGIHAAMEGRHWRDDEETRLRCRKVAVDIIHSLIGPPPNRLMVHGGDPASARKLNRAEEDAREIAADVLYAELQRMAERPPVVKPYPRERIMEQLNERKDD